MRLPSHKGLASRTAQTESRPSHSRGSVLSMKIIDRQTILSVLFTMVFGVAVLSPFLIMGNVMRDLLDLMINQDLPLQFVLLFMGLAGIFTLTFTIPWGLLVAQLLIFGRMSADNEILALKASGVSVLRIALPVFLLAFLLSGFCFWINAEIAPRAKVKMASLLRELALRDPASLFRANDVLDQFPHSRIYVGGREGNKLKDLFIFEIDEAGNFVRSIFAREADLSRDPAGSGLRLQFRSARFQERNRSHPSDVTRILPGMAIGEGTYPLSLDRVFAATRRGKRLSDYTLSELSQFIAEGAGGEVLKARVEYARRYSLALACFTLTLAGVPLGIAAHRKETTIGFGLSLIVAFSYFFYIILAQSLASNPKAFPVLLMWFPNVLFGLLGAVLLVRLSRR